MISEKDMKELIKKIPQEYQIKAYNSKTLNVIQVNERTEDLEFLAEHLNGVYDPQNKGSSKGQVVFPENDLRVIVKPNILYETTKENHLIFSSLMKWMNLVFKNIYNIFIL